MDRRKFIESIFYMGALFLFGCFDKIKKSNVVTACEVLVCDKKGYYDKGDIITIQPVGHKWGKGDLKNNKVVALDLELPCGNLWATGKLKCSECEYSKLEWVGDEGRPQSYCPLQRYESADVVFYKDGNKKSDVVLNKRRKHAVNAVSIQSDGIIKITERDIYVK